LVFHSSTIAMMHGPINISILFSLLGRPGLYARTRSNEPNKRSFVTLHLNDEGNTFSFRNVYMNCASDNVHV